MGRNNIICLKMKLFVGLILFSGVFANESTDAASDGEAIVETVADEAQAAASASEELPGVQDPVTGEKKLHRERIYTEEEKKQMRQLMREREEYNRQFMPPEKRFDFNKMKRRMVPKPEMGENVADVHYDMQTIEESQEEEKRERLRMKFMKPEELAKIHERELAEF